MLLLQPVQQIAPLLDGAQTLGIGLDVARVRARRLGELSGARERRVEQLLPRAHRGVDAQETRQDLLRLGEPGGVDCFLELAREPAELLGVRQPFGLHFECLILTELRLGTLDLLEDMTQVVRLLAHVRLAIRELRFALLEFFEPRVRVADGDAFDIGIRVGVQHVALRLGTEQRLCLVLAMQVHEQAADLAEHTDRYRRAVDPRTGLAFTQHFALQDQTSLFELNPKCGERGQQVPMRCRPEFEGALDDRLLRAGSDDVGRGALAEQQREGVDDHRFAGPGFAGQNVEAGLERQRDVGNDGEIADAQFGQHVLTP